MGCPQMWHGRCWRRRRACALRQGRPVRPLLRGTVVPFVGGCDARPCRGVGRASGPVWSRACTVRGGRPCGLVAWCVGAGVVVDPEVVVVVAVGDPSVQVGYVVPADRVGGVESWAGGAPSGASDVEGSQYRDGSGDVAGEQDGCEWHVVSLSVVRVGGYSSRVTSHTTSTTRMTTTSTRSRLMALPTLDGTSEPKRA